MAITLATVLGTLGSTLLPASAAVAPTTAGIIGGTVVPIAGGVAGSGFTAAAVGVGAASAAVSAGSIGVSVAQAAGAFNPDLPAIDERTFAEKSRQSAIKRSQEAYASDDTTIVETTGAGGGDFELGTGTQVVGVA